MATIGSVKIGISALTGGLESGLKKARKLLKGFTKNVATVQSGLVGLGVGLGVGAIFNKAIHSASDLAETIDKTKIVLGESSAEVFKFADSVADQFGLIKREVIDTASSFGAIGKGIGGLDGQALTDFSVHLTKLAIDVGSMANKDLAESSQAISIGLTGGESDTLKRLGAIVTETTVKQYALANGIAKVGEEMSNQQKLAARVGLITQKLADAQDNLKNTAEGVANLERGAWGRFENLMADAGQAIEPITVAFLKLANTGLAAVANAIEMNKAGFASWVAQATAGNVGVVDSFGPVITGIGWIADTWQVMGQAFRVVFMVINTAIALFVKSLAVLGHAFDALINAFKPNTSRIGEVLDEAANGIAREVTKAAQDFGEAHKDSWNSAKIKSFFDEMKAGAKGASVEIKKSNFTMNALSDSAEADRKKLEKLREDAKKLTESVQTPLEEFRAEAAKTQELYSKGLISEDVFNRANGKSFQDLQSASDKGGSDTKYAGALELGSKEARSAVLAARGQNPGDKTKQLIDVNKQQLEELHSLATDMKSFVKTVGVPAPTMAII